VEADPKFFIVRGKNIQPILLPHETSIGADAQ
jgi:hypothetical protein